MRRIALASVTMLLLQLVWIVPAGAAGRFDDVPEGHTFETEIEWLAERGITKGCNPSEGNTRFCPDDPVTRGQMAAFLVRAFGYSEEGTSSFIDDSGVFQSDIRKLANAGVTKGCNPSEGNTRFCPNDRVTRGQMAAFLTRAFGYFDEGTASFSDDAGVFQSDIRKLATQGVTKGCNPPANTRFCPNDPVTRGQMAAFLYRAFYVPGGGTTPLPTTTTTSTTVYTGPPIPASTDRVSLDSAENQATGQSVHAVVSGNGRYVAFESDAPNLVAGDTNGVTDVFVRDRMAGITERVSVGKEGAQANGASSEPWISADGRYVVFQSVSSNLVSGDDNPADPATRVSDIFLHDRNADTTTMLSVSSGGAKGNGDSLLPSISPDGRYVVFQSSSSNLAPNDTNGTISDVFLRDTELETTEMVSRPVGSSLGSNGGSGNAYVTFDGRFVVFQSGASDLVPGDTNQKQDVFVRDRSLNRTARVSVSSSGQQGNSDSYGPAAISANGKFVVFESDATNLVSGDTNGFRDIFLRTIDDVAIGLDRGVTTLVSRASGTAGAIGTDNSYAPVISDSGQFVAYHSQAGNLVSGDTNGNFDIFVRNTVANTTLLASADDAGNEGNNHSYNPSISADGRYVGFSSFASDLVPGDTNGVQDVFLRDRGMPLG